MVVTVMIVIAVVSVSDARSAGTSRHGTRKVWRDAIAVIGRIGGSPLPMRFSEGDGGFADPLPEEPGEV